MIVSMTQDQKLEIFKLLQKLKSIPLDQVFSVLDRKPDTEVGDFIEKVREFHRDVDRISFEQGKQVCR